MERAGVWNRSRIAVAINFSRNDRSALFVSLGGTVGAAALLEMLQTVVARFGGAFDRSANTYTIPPYKFSDTYEREGVAGPTK